MRRLLLHVGSPKCGSTYLQRVMLNNRARLRAAGIAYPHDGGAHPGNAADIDRLTAASLAGLYADGIHTVLLSHEDLYPPSRKGEPLAALAPDLGVEVQILVFLRPFPEFVYGDYSQQMKQFFPAWLKTRAPYDGDDFDRFARRRTTTLLPAQFIARWARLFPDRPPIIAGHRHIQAVLEPFLGDVPGMDWALHHDLANPSLRITDCEALARALRDPAIGHGRLKDMFRAAFHATGRPDPGRTPARNARIEALFAPQNAALRRHFGYDNRLAPE